MAPTYKLIYFKARARAETIRYIFAAAGVKYEDTRLEFSDWPALKSGMPWGALPVLEVDGKQLAESSAICRYLAKETGLAGANAMETALIDSVATTMSDIREKFIAVKFSKFDEKTKEQQQKTYKEETVPQVLEKLEKFLKNNDYFVGNKLSWADLNFLTMWDVLKEQQPNALDVYPKLNALQQRVAALPKMAAWIKNRPQTDF